MVADVNRAEKLLPRTQFAPSCSSQDKKWCTKMICASAQVKPKKFDKEKMQH